MNNELEKAHKFLFDETYQMWQSDLRKIFRIGTKGTKGGCNLSSCILVFIGIESFSKFFSEKKNDAAAVADFVDKYYPEFYRGKMEKIYDLFRHGLAHNYYPKSEFNLKNTTRIAFGVDENNHVIPLSRIKNILDSCRNNVQNLSPRPGKPYVVVPQVLFLDTVNVMEKLKKQLKRDSTLQQILINNHKRIRQILRHPC